MLLEKEMQECDSWVCRMSMYELHLQESGDRSIICLYK